MIIPQRKHYIDYNRINYNSPQARNLCLCFPLEPGVTGGVGAEREISKQLKLIDGAIGGADNVLVVPTYAGNAYQFHDNGSNTESFKTSGPFTLSTERVTLTAWARLNVYSNNYQGIANTISTASTGYLGLFISDNGATDTQLTGWVRTNNINGTNLYSLATGLVVPLNEWVFTALVWCGDCPTGLANPYTEEMSVYLWTQSAGLQSYTITRTGSAATPYTLSLDFNASNFHIGWTNASSARCWRGNVKDVRVYNQTLTTNELLSMIVNRDDLYCPIRRYKPYYASSPSVSAGGFYRHFQNLGIY